MQRIFIFFIIFIVALCYFAPDILSNRLAELSELCKMIWLMLVLLSASFLHMFGVNHPGMARALAVVMLAFILYVVWKILAARRRSDY